MVEVNLIISEDIKGATYKKVLSKVKKEIQEVIDDENLRGYTIKSDDEAIWVLN